MKPAAFEEKEYEAPLYNQLEAGCQNVWSPGQVFENQVGIDRAMLVSCPRIWQLLGRRMPVGAFMNRYPWPFWRHRDRRPLPNFSLNLFIQAKRPNYYPRSPRHIRVNGMTGACWCFNVDADQQKALERLTRRLGNRAAIVYASPVFHTVSKLFAHTKLGSVIEHSNFPDASQLRGHSKWFYNSAGGSGIANPDAAPSEGQSLMDRIQRLASNQPSQSESPAMQELAYLAKAIVTELQELNDEDNARVAYFFEELRTIDAELPLSGLEPGFESVNPERVAEYFRDFIRVALFSAVFNVEWFTIK